MLESFANKIIATFLAHPDDETLGCGGTLARAVMEGAKVHCIIPVKRIEDYCVRALETLGVENLYWGVFDDNSMDKYPLLNVCKFVSKYLEKIKPDILITHHHNCTNQDHRVCYQASCIALRQKPTALLTCEIPSSTGYLKPINFEPNFYVKLLEQDIFTKIRAMECYKSEIEQFPHPFSEEYVRSLARIRGSEINSNYAEGFMLVRGYV